MTEPEFITDPIEEAISLAHHLSRVEEYEVLYAIPATYMGQPRRTCARCKSAAEAVRALGYCDECEELLARYQWVLNQLYDAVAPTSALLWEGPTNIRYAMEQAAIVLNRNQP